jgi:hypothetical protein
MKQMRIVLFVLVFLASFGGLLAVFTLEGNVFALWPKSEKQAKAAQEAKAAAQEAKALEILQSQLFDPWSAQLRDVEHRPNDVVCGRINAKNRYGGYVGFRIFAVNLETREAFIVPDVDGIIARGTASPSKAAMEELDRAIAMLRLVSGLCKQ